MYPPVANSIIFGVTGVVNIIQYIALAVNNVLGGAYVC